MIDKDKLVYLIEESKKIVEEVCGNYCPVIDSANFQAKSKADFEKFTEKFADDNLKFLLEVDHAGRRIQVFNVLDDSLGINFVELTEPKPASKLDKNEWEYVSFVSDQYEKCLEMFSDSKYKVKKIREVAGTRYFYMITPNVLIQVRDKSVGNIVQGMEDGDEGENHMESEDIAVVDEVVGESDVDDEGDVDDERGYKGKYARLMADFENYRRIQEQQNGNLAVNSKVEVVGDVLEVIDDFERALENEPNEGFGAIMDKLNAVLEQNGVEEIVVKAGDKFDAGKMEAVTTVPVADAEQDNTVQEVLQRGYVHSESGKIVRLPKVVVGKFEE